MDVEKEFHMTAGLDDTSYAKNSSFQRKASDKVKHITMETLREVYAELAPDSLGIADLGCSSGPNTLSMMKDLVQLVQQGTASPSTRCKEIRVYLNDLPCNDFNTLFKALPDFYRELDTLSSLKKSSKAGAASETSPSFNTYIVACPGSFYGRLFPNNCLHFIHSSLSLHWLSKVPPGLYDEEGKSTNKGAIYISKTSPPGVSQAYTTQFREDFSLFLRSRSEEMVSGGRMVLTLICRRDLEHVDRGNSFYWELLARSFALLVSQGQVEQEKLDSYNVHIYIPCEEDIVDVVRKEGSFELDHLEIFEADEGEADIEGESYGTDVARTVRAIQESMICNHFGGDILDTLFEIYGRLVDEEMGKGVIKPHAFALVLRRML